MAAIHRSILRRNRPGTKYENFNQWEDQRLDDMESTVALQQYIQTLIKNNFSDTKSILQLPEYYDENLWIYEHIRQVCLELNAWIVRLSEECNRENCLQMSIKDSLFLCASHEPMKECCAIDYISHTLDSSINQLLSFKHFPSRASVPDNAIKLLKNIIRRLTRIFAHVWHHHNHIFVELELGKDPEHLLPSKAGFSS